MGGLVKVIIRKEDGQIISMNRWTSGLCNILHDPEIYLADTNALELYLKPYFDAVADYEKHKEDKKFEINMTSSCIFDGHDNLAPVDYGIVILDLMTKTLISCNGYSNRGTFVSYSDNDNNYERKGLNLDHSVITEEEFVDMLANDKIKELMDTSGQHRVSLNGIRTLTEANKCAEQLAKTLSDYGKGKIPGMLVVINRNDFELNFYLENRLDEVKAKMKRIGFEFSESDELGWTQFENKLQEVLE